jgi:putative ABC transport system permease protein
MKLWSWLRTVTAFVFHRRSVEREMEDEFRAHLEIRAADLERQGLSRTEAERRSRIEFGGYQKYKEECREALGTRLLQELVADLRYGLRQLRRNPSFTVIAVLTLALGIGANMAIFSVVNAVLLQPLPYKNPGRLVWVSEVWPHGGSKSNFVPRPDFINWRNQNHVFKDIAAYGGQKNLDLTGVGEPQRIPAVRVSGSFFRVLGVGPTVGRGFLPQEDQQGGTRAVVLSHKIWQRLFSSNPAILGKPVTLDGQGYTVVGVLPAGFRFPDNNLEADLLLPIALTNNGNWYNLEKSIRLIHAVARLRPGTTRSRARSDLKMILDRTVVQTPLAIIHMRGKIRIEVIGLHDKLVGNSRPVLLILLGAVCFVLLVACANVANLMMARATVRQREFAIRLTLGAARMRLIRQLLSESVIVSGLGTAAGLLVAHWGVRILRSPGSPEIPALREAAISGWVLGFVLAIAALTALLFGLAPAILSSRPELNEMLKKAGMATGSGIGHHRLRAILMVAELGLAMVLLTGSGLLIRTFLRLTAVDPGFRSRNILTLRIQLPSGKYSKPEQQAAFFQQALERVNALPGVQSAAATTSLPLTAYRNTRGVVVEGRPVPPPGVAPSAPYTAVSPGYFRTMGIPLIAGRYFNAQDTEGSPGAVIVNQAFARRYFPEENPLRKRLRSVLSASNPQTIVGIVGNVRHLGPAHTASPEFYAPYLQHPTPDMMLAIRTASNPSGLSSAVQGAVQSVDKNQPVYDVATMGQRLAGSIAAQRFNMFLIGAFAGLSLLLASVGIYGVISYSIAQRTHDIGVRMALGAERRDVLKMVVGQGLGPALIGVAIGIAGALALTRFLSSLLYGVKPTDALTFIAVSLILIAVSLLACYIPARRAAKVDPMVALKYE